MNDNNILSFRRLRDTDILLTPGNDNLSREERAKHPPGPVSGYWSAPRRDDSFWRAPFMPPLPRPILDFD